MKISQVLYYNPTANAYGADMPTVKPGEAVGVRVVVTNDGAALKTAGMVIVLTAPDGANYRVPISGIHGMGIYPGASYIWGNKVSGNYSEGIWLFTASLSVMNGAWQEVETKSGIAAITGVVPEVPLLPPEAPPPEVPPPPGEVPAVPGVKPAISPMLAIVLGVALLGVAIVIGGDLK